METNERISDQKKWNNILIKAYWYILLFYSTVTSINLLVNVAIIHTDDEQFVQSTIRVALLQGVGLGLLAMILTTMIYRRWSSHPYIDYITITSGFVVCTVLASSSAAIENIHALYYIPLLGSTLFFHARKLIYACVCFVLSLLFLITCIPLYTTFMEPMDYVPAYAIVAAACVIAYGIYKRSLEVLGELQKQTEIQEALRARKEAAGRLVYYDPLTGLHNHKSYQEQMDAALKQSEGKRERFHLAIMDIDNFKWINDTFGHWVGDAVLKWLGQLFRSLLPQESVVPARYGGEEFTVLFKELSADEALAVLEVIRKQVEAAKHEQLQGRNVTISIGFISFNQGETKDELFAKADEQLYRSKHAGKNRLSRYEVS